MCESCCNKIFPFHKYSAEDEFLSELHALKKIDHNMPLADSDPDLNSYSDYSKNILRECLYYSSEEFSEMYESQHAVSTSVLAISHINIRSISAHLSEL